jgi:hypothetical protein
VSLRGAVVLAACVLAWPAAAQVYRCGNAYSSTPCAGGKTVDTSPPLSAQGDSAPNTTLYLCRSYGGGLFWTREHCGRRNALVERMESVPHGMSFEQQVEMAQDQRRSAQDQAAPPPAPVQAPQPSSALGAQSLRSQCQALDERVRHLDARARAGGSPAYLDAIAHERKTARDRQFRLRCN